MEEKKLREALKRDFNHLYVKEFTFAWRMERVVRAIEIDLMSLKNTMGVIDNANLKERIHQKNTRS